MSNQSQKSAGNEKKYTSAGIFIFQKVQKWTILWLEPKTSKSKAEVPQKSKNCGKIQNLTLKKHPNLFGHPLVVVFVAERRHFFLVGWSFFKPPLSCLWSLSSSIGRELSLVSFCATFAALLSNEGTNSSFLILPSLLSKQKQKPRQQ